MGLLQDLQDGTMLQKYNFYCGLSTLLPIILYLLSCLFPGAKGGNFDRRDGAMAFAYFWSLGVLWCISWYANKTMTILGGGNNEDLRVLWVALFIFANLALVLTVLATCLADDVNFKQWHIVTYDSILATTFFFWFLFTGTFSYLIRSRSRSNPLEMFQLDSA